MLIYIYIYFGVRVLASVLCFQKLKLMLLKKDDTKTNSLMSHLRKINEHLGRKGTRFLTGDTMCCFDCELMPRLQHIRVAGDCINYITNKVLLCTVANSSTLFLPAGRYIRSISQMNTSALWEQTWSVLGEIYGFHVDDKYEDDLFFRMLNHVVY